MNVNLSAQDITVAAVFYFSLVEHTLHKYFMHRVFPIRLEFLKWKFAYNIEFAVKSHAGIHHRIYKSDGTFHMSDPKHRKTIPMAWWHGPALVSFTTILVPLPLSLILQDWSIVIISFLVGAAYFVAYERIHWCMHLPLAKKRWIERLWIIGDIFYYLKCHHLLHHRYPDSNFNVVLPIWDLLFRTLIFREKNRFKRWRDYFFIRSRLSHQTDALAA